ncbi:hypothetical protein SUGI_0610740 [Cryptomeria japonica]|nr:hypothetical protein SUGI_0610740 [Cryptomeria japonica]
MEAEDFIARKSELVGLLVRSGEPKLLQRTMYSISDKTLSAIVFGSTSIKERKEGKDVSTLGVDSNSQSTSCDARCTYLTILSFKTWMRVIQKFSPGITNSQL